MAINDYINLKNKVNNKKNNKLKTNILSFIIGTILGTFFFFSIIIFEERKFLYTFYFQDEQNFNYIIKSYEENNINFYELELFDYLAKCYDENIHYSKKVVCAHVLILNHKKINDLSYITYFILENYYFNNELYKKDKELIEFYLNYEYFNKIFCQNLFMARDIKYYRDCSNRKKFLKTIEDLAIGNNKNS